MSDESDNDLRAAAHISARAPDLEIRRLRAENEKLRYQYKELKKLWDAGNEAWNPVFKIVCDERDAFRAENEKLRAALKPFAEYEFDDMDDDEDETASPFILVKHLRAAAAALKETGDE